MTRRLEPLDRVEELGGASVPFQFDVHALIFTEDAPSLEAALHRAFEKQKVNKVNPRREFFHVSLEQIKRVVRENYDKTVEWIDIPPAEQFRQSLLIGKTDAPAQIDRTVPQLTTPMDSVSVSTPKNVASTKHACTSCSITCFYSKGNIASSYHSRSCRCPFADCLPAFTKHCT